MSQDVQFLIVMTCIAAAALTVLWRCWCALASAETEGSCGGCHGCESKSDGPLVQLDLSKRH